MSEKLLFAKDLYKEYRNGSQICTAVNHIDLEIEKGEFISIVGASGSGKSSLINLLSGMDNPTSGEVFYKSKNICEITDKEKAYYRGKEIGFVFQENNLLEDLTMLRNICLPACLYEKRKSVEERVDKWLNYMGLENHKNKYPNELSGGQKQRAAIVRALINKPKIIFSDEPTGSLDTIMGENILELLVSLNKKGQSIVMVTHDMGAAARADKIIKIKDGLIEKTLFLGKYERENSTDFLCYSKNVIQNPFFLNQKCVFQKKIFQKNFNLKTQIDCCFEINLC